MASTAKYTFVNLILVVTVHQYLSFQFQNSHKRSKRAVLQDEKNSTLSARGLTPTLDQMSGLTADPNVSTVAFNTTLSSAEKMQQLEKLKNAEMHLRRNLRERGKEYENQLYEHWPKYVDQIEQAGPSFFQDKEGLAMLDILNQTLSQVYSNWKGIILKLRSEEMKKILSNYLSKIKNGDPSQTTPQLLKSLEQEGVKSFQDPYGQAMLAHLNLSYKDVEKHWPRIMKRARHSRFKTIIADYLRRLMRGVPTLPSTRKFSYHKGLYGFTIMPRITLFRYITDDDFREVTDLEAEADFNQGFSSEYMERREKFAKEKLDIFVKQGRATTTMPIIATETPIDSYYSTCYHFFWE